MKLKLILFSFSILLAFSAFSQKRTDEEAVRAVADNILKQPVTQFVGVSDGKIYNSTKEIPKGTDVKFKSPLTEWHYSNGVLDMAMITLGKYLNEPKYIDYAKDMLSLGLLTMNTSKILSDTTADIGTGRSDSFGILKSWTTRSDGGGSN